MKKDDIGDRMKEYEYVSRTFLTKRTPVIIRVDGKAFHTFTKGLDKPFDNLLVYTMQETMRYLCENIQGCVLGYTQSDEITLVLVDYKKLNSDSWFGNNIQKMASVSASMATMAFNKVFREMGVLETDLANEERFRKLESKFNKALFDSRVFNIPKEEVTNCLIWRQQDAIRNSIAAVAQSKFPHKQLMNKNCNQLQEMLFQEHGLNWNDIETHLKRGSCCVKERYIINQGTDNEVSRNRWIVDENIPVFTQDRDYIEKLISV